MKQSSADRLGTLIGFISGAFFILFGILFPAEFSNVTGLTTIAVSDATVDATTLATRIDSYDTINGDGKTTDMTLASGATINVDAGEITHMLADRTAGRLTIDDQKITVNPAGSITVDTANDLSGITTGVLTATIDPTETVGELATLSADGIDNNNQGRRCYSCNSRSVKYDQGCDSYSG